VADVEAVMGNLAGQFYLMYRIQGKWKFVAGLTCPNTCPAQYSTCINSLALDSGYVVCSSPYTGIF
jgi:hypothetical protein